MTRSFSFYSSQSMLNNNNNNINNLGITLTAMLVKSIIWAVTREAKFTVKNDREKKKEFKF